MKRQAIEINRLLTVLNDSKAPEEGKKLAEERLREIKDEVEAQELIDEGISPDRAYDVLYLLKRLNNPFSTPEEKEMAKRGIDKIRKEDSGVKSMRKSLIKEVRKGNALNVRDIGEYVIKHGKYQ